MTVRSRWSRGNPALLPSGHVTQLPPLDRRSFLRGAGYGGLVVAASPVLWSQAQAAGAPPVDQLHLGFGDDAATEMTVSWVSADRVRRPRVRLGTPRGGPGVVVGAETRTYRDAVTGREVFTHHARLTGLRPGSRYVYSATHDGAPAESGTFRTAPRGRVPFRFTSFGDQGTGIDDGSTSTVWGDYVVDQVESLDPLFHLLNGDLCYGNLADDRPAAWDAFFRNNSRSARNRPWMPALGNHENESGNGPQGFASYLTRFALPDNGSRAFRGNWYAFTAGSVRFVSIDADDAAYQNGGDFPLRGYSGGEQERWLDRTLAAARRDPAVDWVVVVMHQLLMSSALAANGPDLGVRERFLPIFDKHGVDLVLCGHDHHYERCHPVRGTESAAFTDRPRVVGTSLEEVDTTQGLVQLVVGGGGSVDLHHVTSLSRLPAGATAVITGPGGTDREIEETTWSAVVDHNNGYGFVSVDVDPGRPGGDTRLVVTHYRTGEGRRAAPMPFDRVVLRRPRRG